MKDVLNIDFDPAIMKTALQQNNNFANEPDKAKLNSDLHCIGKAAVYTACMVGALLPNEDISASELHQLTNKKKAAFNDAFLERYDIRKFVSARGMQLEQAVSSVICQLIGAVFISNSLYSAFHFLLDVVKSSEYVDITDHKTLVQDHAQKHKIQYKYEYERNRSLDGRDFFKAILIYNGKTYLGEGYSKKTASMNAAKNCVKANNLIIEKQGKGKKPNNTKIKGELLTDKRKEELSSLRQRLSISQAALQDYDLNIAFTHNSFLNDYIITDKPNLHSVYKEIGAEVLLLSIGCVLFTETTKGDLSIRIREITAGSAIEKAANLQLFPYIRVSKGVHNLDDIEKKRIVSECYKAVLGATFLQYLKSGNVIQYNAYKNLLYQLVAANKGYSYVDYPSKLQNFAQALGNKVEYQITQQYSDSANKEYSVMVIYNSRGDTVSASGSGRNLRAARNAAAESLLKILLDPRKKDR